MRTSGGVVSVMSPEHRQRAFRYAAAMGWSSFVHTWCATVSQNTVDRAIQLAARNGHLACLKFLTQHSTNPPNFALVQAARRGHVWCVKHLLKSALAEYCDGWAIRLAAKYGFDRCVDALFESSLNCLHLRNNEAYRNALCSTNIKSIKRLRDRGPNRIVNINDEMPAYWKNKLFAAVRQKNLQKAIDIITLCNPSVKNDIDICLCVCAIFNYQQCVEFFVQHGADHTRNNHNCLRQAAAKKHRSMFHYIWSLGQIDTLTATDVMYYCQKTNWNNEVHMLFDAANCSMRAQHLANAAREGYTHWVIAFLPHVNPKSDNSKSLQWTCLSRNQTIFDILYDVSDVDAALQDVSNDAMLRHPLYTNDDREWLVHQVARKQKERLCNAIGECTPVTLQRKI